MNGKAKGIFELTEEDMTTSATHLGSVLSADLEDLPKGELQGRAAC